MVIINRLLNSVVFWAAWIIIPVIMEIVPSVASVFLLLKRHWRKRKTYTKPKVYPEISLIVPVYNSEATLFGCIKSIYDCDYPNDRMRVFLVNKRQSTLIHFVVSAVGINDAQQSVYGSVGIVGNGVKN